MTSNEGTNVMHRKALPLAITALLTQAALAQDPQPIEEMVITTVRMSEPLVVTTDPRQPRQPLPAHDGADFLKTIPGFSVIRKGGADGDPVFRGMAGSRLSLLVDGETVLGGCGHRMDPPTAYIFPEAFDSVEIIKGPQSVQYGPGNAAGVVRFERNRERPTEAGWSAHLSGLAASFGRHDEVLDVRYSTTEFSLRGTGTNAQQKDYRDGDGNRVHSQYHRWSGQLSAAWTPSDDIYIEVSGGVSDGEAAYADRGMDGSLFEREHFGVKAEFRNVTDLISAVDAQLYYQYVDHVMDNYSLRSVSGNQRAMNPDRETRGGRLAVTLEPNVAMNWTVGIDRQENYHTNRGSMNQAMMPYQNMERLKDAEFAQTGAFTELRWDVSDAGTVITGLRADHWKVHDLRETIALTMINQVPNPTAGNRRSETLTSAFARYEVQPEWLPGMLYVGIGHNDRFPDYWEIATRESMDELSVFNTIESEKVTQIDTGVIYNVGPLHGSVSLFYNEIADFILIDATVMKPQVSGGMPGGMDIGMTQMRPATVARNIDARSWGAEADFTYAISDNWRTELTLASVRGRNKTDAAALPQLPPLEATVGINYDNQTWSAGAFTRLARAQKHFDAGRGNIAGQDIGATTGFGVLSLNAGWRPGNNWLVTAGIDNVLDRSYAEHISRAGDAVAGYRQTTRVNEPGRTLWMKAQFTF